MPNIPQDVWQLQKDVDELRAEMAELRERQEGFWRRIRYMLRSYRAAILRLEVGDSGERYHVGYAYTLGSRLRIPTRVPRILAEWKSMNPKWERRDSHKDSLAFEEVVSGPRHGIPKRV